MLVLSGALNHSNDIPIAKRHVQSSNNVSLVAERASRHFSFIETADLLIQLYSNGQCQVSSCL